MRLLLAAIAICLTTLCTLGQAQEDKAKETKTHVVKKGFFEVVETVPATVESKSMTAVVADTENWSDLVIEKIVSEGTRVSKDQPIVWFNTEKIDRKIKETEKAIALAKLGLNSTKLAMDQLYKTFDLDLKLAQRKHRNAQQDHKYFNAVEKPNLIRSTERSLKNSQWQLEYAQEELNQLERMYEEDELTEESEEIVLKRTRRGVENSQFYLEQAQIRATHTLETKLPRQSEQKDEQLERAKLEFAKAKLTLPIERDKKQVEFAKAELELKNQQDDFAKLQSDLKRMVVNAPADGVLYFGRCVRGKWLSATGSGSRDLEKGKTIARKKTVVTIVDPSQLILRAELNEKQLSKVKQGARGLATPAAFPDAKLQANVTSVNYVPVAADKFDCQIVVADSPAQLMPGMTCSVRFVVQQKDDALTVPASAVFSDDGQQHYVFVKSGESQTKTNVTVGLTADKKMEILDGLKAGDTILLERP